MVLAKAVVLMGGPDTCVTCHVQLVASSANSIIPVHVMCVIQICMEISVKSPAVKTVKYQTESTSVVKTTDIVNKVVKLDFGANLVRLTVQLDAMGPYVTEPLVHVLMGVPMSFMVRRARLNVTSTVCRRK